MKDKEVVVGFFGLSHLGVVNAISLATKSVKTIGIDSNTELIKSLREKKWPIQEPEIDEQYVKAQGFITFTDELGAIST